MNDIQNNIIKIGDTVAYAPGGSYSGIKLGEVIAFTPLKVKIKGEHNGRHIHSKTYLAYPTQIIVIK